MPPLLSITINGRPVSVRSTSTVLQACEAAGVEVPRFCYHPSLSVAGNCRRCLVEVQKSPKPVVACARPVAPNRVVLTDTPLVRKAREAVLEFLLLNHPLDCPICDQGGECDLQDEARAYGSDRGRNYDGKRSVEDKECGPVVKTIRTRCIHCTRCVRFAAEVAGIETLGAFGRGEETEIGTYLPTLLRTELAGNLVDLCPVGALTSKPYAYTARRWELTSVDTLDPLDAIAADITAQTRGSRRSAPSATPASLQTLGSSPERLLRVLPRSNGLYAEVWLSDRSRYAHDALTRGRLVAPQLGGRLSSLRIDRTSPTSVQASSLLSPSSVSPLSGPAS
jgi:NADH dehydrogenase/NADH:ubiquinone oxidoreductase subunit G